MSRPQFSVLIPSYNHRRYLGAALRSALRSECVGEILVTDDGSDDGSRDLVDQLEGRFPRQVRTLPSHDNQGAAVRLNALVDAARCEWVSILNSDDWFLPGRFRAIRAALGRDAPVLVFGYLLVVNQEGRTIATKRAVHDPEFPFPAASAPVSRFRAGEHAGLLANQNYIATTSNMTFAKSLHRRVGGFRPYRYVHDWDFAIRSSANGKLKGLPRFLSAYRLHPSNTIAESRAAVESEVRVMFERVIADYPALMDNDDFRCGLAENPYLEPGAAA